MIPVIYDGSGGSFVIHPTAGKLPVISDGSGGDFIVVPGTGKVPVIFDGSGGAAVNIASSPPATHFSVTQIGTTTMGANMVFSVTALTAANATATGYNGTVTFASSDLGARLPANATLSGGVGTFSCTLYGAANQTVGGAVVGNQTLTATDTVTSSITGSTSAITVNPYFLAFDTPFSQTVGTLATAYTLPFGGPWTNVPDKLRTGDNWIMKTQATGFNNTGVVLAAHTAPGGMAVNLGQTDVYFQVELPTQSIPVSSNPALLTKGQGSGVTNTSTGGAGCYVFLGFGATNELEFDINNNGNSSPPGAGSGWDNNLNSCTGVNIGSGLQRYTVKCTTGSGPSGSNQYTWYKETQYGPAAQLNYTSPAIPNDSGTGANNAPVLNVQTGTYFGICQPNTSLNTGLTYRSVAANSIAFGTPPFWAVPTSGGLYYLPHFSGANAGDELLSVCGSVDGINYVLVPSCNNNGAAQSGTHFTPTTGTCRDPSLFADSRMSLTQRLIAYTNGSINIPGATTFGVSLSTDGQSWPSTAFPNFLQGQSPGGIANITTVWAPHYFLDPNGPFDPVTGLPCFYDSATDHHGQAGSALHIFFVAFDTNTFPGTLCTIYETHPLNPGHTLYSPAVMLQNTLGQKVDHPAIDPDMQWDGTHYNLTLRHASQNASDFLLVYQSTSLLTGYGTTPWQTGNWTSQLGSNTWEAPCWLKSPDGSKHILLTDKFGASGGIWALTQPVGPHDWQHDNTGTMSPFTAPQQIQVPFTTIPRSGKALQIK